MSEVFLERVFDPPIAAADVFRMARLGKGCFSVYRIRWHGSALAADGRRMICHFSGADAESVRTALRMTGADIFRLWPGTVHLAPDRAPADQAAANVVVERSFDEPVTLPEIQAIEDAGAWCLEAHNVTFLRTYFSWDKKRMICLYRAPDAESVRIAQRQAKMPVEDVWAFSAIQPEN